MINNCFKKNVHGYTFMNKLCYFYSDFQVTAASVFVPDKNCLNESVAAVDENGVIKWFLSGKEVQLAEETD